MIVFFGPAGAGKSTQGKLLAERQGWLWISAGDLLRNTNDPEILRIISEGKLVPHEKVNELMGEAIKGAHDYKNIIIDGFTRKIEEAEYLVESYPLHKRSIDIAIVLDVPETELLERLSIRGRVDDTPEAIRERFDLYHRDVEVMLDYYRGHGIKIVHIDGSGGVEEVYDRVVRELAECHLV